MGAYVPERGDVVWLEFDPQAGHEQAGRQPALVVSPGSYNNRAGLALVWPIASRRKGYPFEVPLPPGLDVTGVVLTDQVKSLDWRARGASRAGTVTPEVLDDAVARLLAIVDPD
jgi:mRNA interferase MazF